MGLQLPKNKARALFVLVLVHEARNNDRGRRMDAVDYLNSERQKLWARTDELRELIEKKTPEYEQEARQASKKASEFRNRCEATSTEAAALLREIDVIRESSNDSATLIAQIAQAMEKTREPAQEILEIHDELVRKKQSIDEHISHLEKLSAEISAFSAKLGNLETFFNQAEDFSSKVEINYNQISSRKKEVDELYYGILGFKSTDPETGEELETPGLKQELEEAYSELKGNFSRFYGEKEKQFNSSLSAWNTEYGSAVTKLRSLLPEALTAGLSAAYSEKKNNEIQECKDLDNTFQKYIKGLVAVSLIPFLVSVFQLVKGIQLREVILQMPQLVFAILPLYVPILWVAYSANRKTNLSKRLIEEYTHKEVLSKTFEGLAEQIENVEDIEVSTELRTRLLYNILEVSSENPGKLISDYNRSDHPLMDALEKSVQLSNAVDKVSKIPGMSRMVELLERRSNAALKTETRKAIDGLDAVATARGNSAGG